MEVKLSTVGCSNQSFVSSPLYSKFYALADELERLRALLDRVFNKGKPYFMSHDYLAHKGRTSPS